MPSGFLNLIKAGYSSVLSSLLAEQFPVESRAVGICVQLEHFGDDFFGGFASFIATWLIAPIGDSLSPSFYLTATALLSIIALPAIQRRAVRARGELRRENSTFWVDNLKIGMTAARLSEYAPVPCPVAASVPECAAAPSS